MNAILNEMKLRIEADTEQPLDAVEVVFLDRINTLDDLKAFTPVPEEFRSIAWDAARALGATSHEAGHIAGDDIPAKLSPVAAIEQPLNNYDYARLSREAQNKILRQNGYRWHKITQADIDDNDWFDTTPGWHLYAPDNREVSVARAFDEINLGAETVAREEREAITRVTERRQAIKRERQELIERMTARGLRECADWSFDNDSLSVGAVIEQTEHFVAREYWQTVNAAYHPNTDSSKYGRFLIGFVLSEAK